MIATGPFDVKLVPQPPGEDAALGRMSIDKTFRGDLEGTGKGQMLAFRSTVQGSAGYVAMEQVTATLHGKSGTFVLQHSGTMTRGAGRALRGDGDRDRRREAFLSARVRPGRRGLTVP